MKKVVNRLAAFSLLMVLAVLLSGFWVGSDTLAGTGEAPEEVTSAATMTGGVLEGEPDAQTVELAPNPVPLGQLGALLSTSPSLAVLNLALLAAAGLMAFVMLMAYSHSYRESLEKGEAPAKNNILQLLGLPLFIMMTVTFVFTQNPAGPYIMADGWTSLFAICLAIQALGALLGARSFAAAKQS